MSHLKALAIALGVGLAAATLTAPAPAEAGSRHFSLSVPGFGIHISKGHGRYYKRHRYKRRHYRPHFYGYYTPRYRYYKKRRYRGGRCGYWAKRCASNWGWHNRNWRGCMRYYGCR